MLPSLSLTSLREAQSTEIPRSVTVTLGPNLKHLSAMRQSGILTDVILQVGPRQIPAHRAILAASSNYFEGLFTSSMREARTDTLVMTDVDPQVFEQFIRSLYGESIDITNWRLALEIYRLSLYYAVRKDLLLNLNLVTVPQQDFPEFSRLFLGIVADDLTQEIVDLIAEKLKHTVDLSEFDDEFIRALLSSPKYQPLNGNRSTFYMINRLVRQGRSHDLFNLVKSVSQFDMLPREYMQGVGTTRGDYLLTTEPPPIIFTGQPFVALPVFPYTDTSISDEFGNSPAGGILRVPRGTVDPLTVTPQQINESYDTLRVVYSIRGVYSSDQPVIVTDYEMRTEERVPNPYSYVFIKDWRPLPGNRYTPAVNVQHSPNQAPNLPGLPNIRFQYRQ